MSTRKNDFRQALDELKRRVSIVALAEEAGLEMRQEGACYKALCPFHDDQATPSLALYPEGGRWKCYGACQENGDVIDFYRRLHDVPFRDAVEALAGKCGVALPGRNGNGNGRAPAPKTKTAPKTAPKEKTSPSAGDFETSPPVREPIDLEDLGSLWPYPKAEAVYIYPLEGGGVAHEVRFVAKGRKRSVLCRPTEWGLIYGLAEGEYAKGNDGCWRAVGSKTRPEALRKRIAGARPKLYRPEIWQKATKGEDWVFLVEGPKDADSAIALGLAATTPPNGASGMKAHHADELHGHRVALVMDHDAAGEKGARKRAKLLAKKAKEVRVLPALGGEPGSGFDLTDWVEAKRRESVPDAELAGELLALAEKAEPWQADDGRRRKKPVFRSGVPQIEITTREKEVADEALEAALERERNLFQRGGNVVHVVRTEPENKKAHVKRPCGSPLIQPMSEPRMKEILAEHCQFVRVEHFDDGKKETYPAHPPRWTGRQLLARAEWPDVPYLEAVVEGPVLRADGSILQKPGYDEASRLLYVPNAQYEPVPEKPTKADLVSALKLIYEVICDFPFSSEEHLAAWLSALLTPMARFAFSGPSPLNLIDANVRGAGKSLLADVCNTIISGRPAARMSYDRRNQEEMRKAITSLALSGTQVVLIDNIRGQFGDATLDRALTAARWRDRLLGGNHTLDVPLQITWYATGNNVTLGADTPRRCLHIRLESPEEKPENRTGFRHPRLVEWVAQERGRILPAALTLLRGYWEAGRPPQGLSGWGSFEAWSDVVRECIVWLGLPDPAETRAELEDVADVEAAAVASLILGLAELLEESGLDQATAAEILEALDNAPAERFARLRGALGELIPRLKAGQDPSSRQLGYVLRQHRGKYVEGACLTAAREKTKHGTVWTVHRQRKSSSPSPPSREALTIDTGSSSPSPPSPPETAFSSSKGDDDVDGDDAYTPRGFARESPSRVRARKEPGRDRVGRSSLSPPSSPPASRGSSQRGAQQ